MKRGILLDLDETLLDRSATLLGYASDLHSEFRERARQNHAEFIKLFQHLDGNGRTPRDQFFFGLAELAFEGVSDDTLEEHFYRCAWQKPELFPGVTASLEAIRQEGIPIGVVTNGREISQSAKIRNSDVGRLVDVFLISESFGVRKPRAEIFLHAAGRLGIDPGASWHVGDDPVADIVGASSAGFRTVWLERHLPWPDIHARCYDLRASQVSEVVSELISA